MLVLPFLGVGEKVFIGDDVVVMMTGIYRFKKGDGNLCEPKVRLGIKAPREVPVFREELVKKTAGLARGGR